MGIGLNQVQAIRDAVCSILERKILPRATDAADVRNWLTTQGLEVRTQEWETDKPFSLIGWAVAEHRRAALGKDWSSAEGMSSSGVNPDAKWVGVHRSGAGWDEGAKFCIAAAFVPLLGSLEQFELDVLKCLLEYRPRGTPGPKEEWEDLFVDMEVVTEVPKVKGDDDTEYYTRPAIWTWIKPTALDKDQRRKIFSRIFNINLAFEDKNRARKEVNKLRKDFFEKRNKIAHGRGGVDFTLKEFVDADVFVMRSMLHLAEECRTKQRLIV